MWDVNGSSLGVTQMMTGAGCIIGRHAHWRRKTKMKSVNEAGVSLATVLVWCGIVLALTINIIGKVVK